MQEVSNPIIIDQLYCDSSVACQNQVNLEFWNLFNCEISTLLKEGFGILSFAPPHHHHQKTSAVEVSEIVYQNIIGTSESPRAIKFDCSYSSVLA